MVRLQVFLTVVYVIGVNGINQQNLRASEEGSRSAAKRQRTAQFDPTVIRTLKNIDYEERQAAPGTMFSLATLEIENCTDICQDGRYLTGSCGQTCRAYYALGEARAEIQALRQYVIRQNREYSLAMNVVIAVVATVILIVCVVAAVGFKLWQKYESEKYQLLREEITTTNRGMEASMRKEFEDKFEQQQIHAIASCDDTAVPIPEQVQHTVNNREELVGLLNGHERG